MASQSVEVALAIALRGGQLARLLDQWQGGKSPDYAALAAAVQGLLRDGRVGLGVRMPAERELAEALGVSRTTVTAAYGVLRDTGHLASRRGAGSWTTLPRGQRIGTAGVWMPTDDRDIIDLGSATFPAPEQLADAAAEALLELPGYTGGSGYHPAGLRPLREAVARRFEARGLPTHADQILITSGVQHAVDLILRLAVSPGQPVLVESPTYPNVIASLQGHRARIVSDNLDPVTGWDPDLLLATVRSARPTLAYLIAEFHNPTGHLMPVGLREQLPAAAHRAGTDLVIDESFVDLPIEDPDEVVPPVASFDRFSRVLSVGGMTKPFWGGLRVGWIRAAAPVIARLTAVRVAVDMAGPVLDQLVALRLLDRADEVIGERRARLRRQRDALLAALAERLPGWGATVPRGGMCLWTELDAPVSTALAHAAHAHGVRLAPGPRFGVNGTLERFVRLPFTLPEPRLREAVDRLAAATSDLGRRDTGAWPPSLVA